MEKVISKFESSFEPRPEGLLLLIVDGIWVYKARAAP